MIIKVSAHKTFAIVAIIFSPTSRFTLASFSILSSSFFFTKSYILSNEKPTIYG